MFVERFMAWSVAAGSNQRVKAISQLAQRYLSDSIAHVELAATEQVFILYLNDPCPSVRAALADAFSKSDKAPRVLVWGLSQDIAQVSASIFEFSPLLKSVDLVHAIEHGDPIVQTAIANRKSVSGDVVRALVVSAGQQAVMALLTNPNVVLGPGLKHDLAKRLGHDPEVRNFLLEDDDLPPASRQILVQQLSTSLLTLVSDNGWQVQNQMEIMTQDATNRAAVDIAKRIENDKMGEYVQHLLETEQLTPALLVRAICEGNAALFENAISLVSGASLKRVQAIIDAGKVSAFEALYSRTGLPQNAYPVFSAAISAWQNAQPEASVLMDIVARLEAEEAEIDGALFAMLGRMVTEEHTESAQFYERQLLLAAA